MGEARSHGLLSTGEAAARLGCTVQHLRHLVRQKKLEGQRFGRDWFVSEGAIEVFKARRYEVTRRPPDRVREPFQVESLLSDPELQPVVNVASVPQRSPFRYPGGKTWLIPIARLWLGSLSPRPRLLVEPFAGGGGIGLMAAFENYVAKSLLVELDPDVASVWAAMLSDEGPVLARLVREFPFSSESVHEELRHEPATRMDRAFATLLRNRVSRGGILAPGAGLVKNGEAGRGMASRWYPETLARRIEAIHTRRSHIEFVEGDGLVAIDRFTNDEGAVLFVDPPYPVAGRRLYRHHNLDHRELFARLSRFQGPILATYDHNPSIEAMALEYGFEVRQVPMKSTHHSRKMELLVARSFEWLPQGLTEGQSEGAA